MAVIKKIQRSAPLTRFNQVVDPGPGVFSVLAQAAQTVFDRADPIAVEQAKRQGAEMGWGDGPRPASFGPSGPDFNFSRIAVGGAAARDDSFSGLRPEMRANLSGLLRAAEAEFGEGALKITSAYRSNEVQAGLWAGALERYGSPEAARKWVAPPGRSKHNTGEAVDFADENGSLLRDGNDPRAVWLRENAPNFGLAVRMDWEPWQVELAASQPPVEIRTEDGQIELRDASMLSSRYDMIRQNAAGAAYSARKVLDGQRDMAEIARSFPLDPNGFAQAADEYLKQATANAPAAVRQELGRELQVEAQRVSNRIREAQYQDTLNRAANETRALTDRYAEQYTDLLASGDQTGAAAALSQLEEVLAYRETIPGQSWTRAQSGNVILDAQSAAQEARRRTATEQQKERRDLVRDVTATADAGRRHDREGLLDDPAFDDVEGIGAARLAIGLRDTMPDFYKMSPSQQRAAIEAERATAVGEAWETELLDRMEAVHTASVSGLNDDPIAFAQERGVVITANDGTEYRAPDVPEFDGTNATDVVAQLAAQGNFARAMQAAGYVDEAQFLTQDQIATFKPLISVEADEEIRAATADLLMQSFGPDAASVAETLTNDNLTINAIGLAGATGDQAVLREIFRNQTLLQASQAQRPEPADRILVDVMPEIQEAIPNLSAGMLASISETAEVLAITEAGSSVPTKDHVGVGAQRALGQTGAGNQRRGGIQEVKVFGHYGQNVLLPPGVRAREATEALQWGLSSNRPSRSGEAAGEPVAWGAAGVPYWGSEPLQLSDLAEIDIIPVVENGEIKTGYYTLRNEAFDVTTQDGRPFILDLNELIALSQGNR